MKFLAAPLTALVLAAGPDSGPGPAPRTPPLPPPTPAQAPAPGPIPAPLTGFVADLSDHLIAITTGFRGTGVLLFGAVRPPAGDIVVTVRGPSFAAVVKRKGRVGPIWLDREEVSFEAPSYYALASTRPLAEIGAKAELERHEIGLERLRFTLLPGQGEAEPPATLPVDFRDAFFRDRQRAGLYPDQPGEVTLLSGLLFQTRFNFPANVVPGIYEVRVLQFEDGHVVNAQSNALEITKVGIEAELYDLATERSLLYGLSAIALALIAGWGASVVFRRA